MLSGHFQLFFYRTSKYKMSSLCWPNGEAPSKTVLFAQYRGTVKDSATTLDQHSDNVSCLTGNWREFWKKPIYCVWGPSHLIRPKLRRENDWSVCRDTDTSETEWLENSPTRHPRVFIIIITGKPITLATLILYRSVRFVYAISYQLHQVLWMLLLVQQVIMGCLYSSWSWWVILSQ